MPIFVTCPQSHVYEVLKFMKVNSEDSWSVVSILRCVVLKTRLYYAFILRKFEIKGFGYIFPAPRCRHGYPNMFNADTGDLATHQFYSAPMLEVFKVVSKSSVLKTEISDSRATVVAKSKAKGMVQTLKVWPIMCEWQQAVHVMLRQKIPEKVEESEIRPDRGTGLHVKDGLKKCHKIAGSPIALTSERALLTEKALGEGQPHKGETATTTITRASPLTIQLFRVCWTERRCESFGPVRENM